MTDEQDKGLTGEQAQGIVHGILDAMTDQACATIRKTTGLEADVVMIAVRNDVRNAEICTTLDGEDLVKLLLVSLHQINVRGDVDVTGIADELTNPKAAND